MSKKSKEIGHVLSDVSTIVFPKTGNKKAVSEISGADETRQAGRDYRWDGTEWCVCSHHVTCHKQLRYLATSTTSKFWVLRMCEEGITSECLGGGRNDNWKCHCRCFKSYQRRESTEQFTGLDEQK